ncbi:hypothetical protein GCM10027598_02170 [Amycolatopsis oliviviridis]|uniref:Uncharacterized protein n=1 Tax=Amycolatopsis oliviviridis TaxID=1471590 RepID=A0ABQ3LYR4_9PSEU|nr:hypothetical protein GCM10017790_43710 [Amycolatopsis oliviviridis]
MSFEDDPADGWFPESVATAYDDPGGDAVEVTIGDMTTTRVAGEFRWSSWCSTRSAT